MKSNLGNLDRIFRFVSGWILLFWGIYFIKDNTLSLLMAIVGVWILIESFFGWCGLHTIFKINLKNQ